MRVVRVPFVRNELAVCARNGTLPSPRCPKPGFYVDVGIAFFRLLFGPHTRLKPVLISTYASRNASDPDYAGSLAGAMELGAADATHPLFILDFQRVARMQSAGFVLRHPVIAMYRSFPIYQPSLSFAKLFIEAQGIWFLIGASLTIILAFKLLEPRGAWAERIRVVTTMLCSFILGLGLSVLSNYVCIVFAAANNYGTPIADLLTLQRQVLRGDYRIVDPGGFLDSMSLPPSFLARLTRLGAAQETGFDDYAELVRGDGLDTRPKHVVLTLESEAAFLEERGLECSVTSTRIEELYFPLTAYFRRGFRLPKVTSRLRTMLQREIARVWPSYRARYPSCPSSAVEPQDPFSLRFRQIYAVCISLLALFLGSLLLCAGEMGLKRIPFWALASHA